MAKGFDFDNLFIYDLAHSTPDEIFRPMTVVNHECNFFGPDASGMSATIDTIFFHEDRAEFPCTFPRDLEALCI